jgi:ABC-type branched-subunit amino acid transport system substrate-binding protein
MTRSRRIPGALAVALALALAATACGDDDDGGDEAAETTAAAAEATTAAPAAETTAAPAADTTAAPEETEAPAAEAFQVPTENCPPEATEPLADGEPIKLAFVGPQTGPAASFGLIGQGMQIYFDKLNAAGGIDGHEIELIVKDDAYDPARSAPAVQEAIEGDQVFASVFQIGTPHVGGTRQLYADACVPQALVGTGFPAWGDPQNFPWTTGGIPSYSVESQVWLDFIGEKFPDAGKVALLTWNNDFGKAYQTALQEAVPAAGLELSADIVHEATSDLSNEVTQLLASGPDVIVGGTTATFCTNLMNLARQGGFTGPILLSYTCAQDIPTFMVPAGQAAANAFALVVTKAPSDPAFEDDPGVQQYKADVEEFGGGADANIGNISSGYNAGYLVEDALTRAAEMEGGLTRANLMNAFWSFDTEAPLSLGGVAKVDGITDAYIAEYGVVSEFDPAAQAYKISDGVEVDAEGEGGIFQG